MSPLHAPTPPSPRAAAPPSADGDPRALLVLAGRHAAAGRWPAAEEPLRRALALVPGDAELHYNLGVVLQSTGRPADAAAQYARALELRPGYAEAAVNLGLLHLEGGRPDQAEACFRAAVAARPALAAAHVNLALAVHRQGRHGEAVEHCGQALCIAPGLAAAHHNRALALLALGRAEEAEADARQAAASGRDAAAQCTLGAALRALGRADEAVAVLRAAVRLDPRLAPAHTALGAVLTEQERLDEAEAALRRALALDPALADAYDALGLLLLERGRPDAAAEAFARAVELRPEWAEARGNLGAALLEVGRTDEARDAFRAALQRAPARGKLYHNLVHAGDRTDSDVLAERMDALLARDGLSPDDRLHLCFAAAALDDEAGRTERAFARWSEGNRLKRARLRYDPAEVEAYFRRLRQTFTAELFARRRGAGSSSDLPVLIVGMPRSGTSLVEQVLASHPQVHGAGELKLLSRLADGLARGGRPYPECAATAPADALRRAGDAYAQALRARAPRARRVCDKMPQNFLELGFAALALPRARVVHCVRDPLDTCFSCFTTLFAGNAVPFACDLDELGRYHALYSGLMAHWRAVLPLPLLEVRYERLVEDAEGTVRELLDFCALPWDPACLEFHRTRRPVRTASNVQVRRPLYRTSVQRWKRYEAQLEPLRRALAGAPMDEENAP